LKQKRQEKILELVERYSIDTQEELLRRLREAGFNVTQATISRDIKELRLLKTLSADRKYRYAPAKEEMRESALKLQALFADSVISIGCAQNIVCVKCLSGVANAICAAFDAIRWEDVVGTIAGNDTIFILSQTDETAKKLADQLKTMVG